jgi:hypothetical protein
MTQLTYGFKLFSRAFLNLDFHGANEEGRNRGTKELKVML